MADQITPILGLIRDCGPAMAPGLILYALWRRWLVIGWQYKGKSDEVDFWKSLYFKERRVRERG